MSHRKTKDTTKGGGGSIETKEGAMTTLKCRINSCTEKICCLRTNNNNKKCKDNKKGAHNCAPFFVIGRIFLIHKSL